ncbi:MAG: hypothetical protein JWP01_428 [Myxococcales bacterium]|nr:hypothetical protein [Myxococcales bacterium]
MAPPNRMHDPEKLLEHAAWLRRLAYSLVRDEAAADELVQDTWLAALRQPPDLNRPARPWLRRVITNVARFRWRTEKHRAARELSMAAVAEQTASSPEDLLERHETQHLLSRLVAELEESYRTTILLRYEEGLSPAAIARRLGIPAGTVRSRLHEGLDRLRVRLDSIHRGDRRSWIVAFAPLARRPAPPLAVPLVVFALIALAVVFLVAANGSSRAEERPAARVTAALLADSVPPPAQAMLHPSQDGTGWIAQTGAPSRRVAGIVVAAGKPVTGSVVRLTSDAARTGMAPVLERRTGDDGRFDFGIQPARESDVGAAAPGLLAAVEHIDLRDPTAQPDALELTLRPCTASLYGTVTDAAGTPIANAEMLREDVIGTTTDATGSYEVCMRQVGSSPEQLRVVLRAPGFGSLMIDVGLAGRERHDFVLTPEAVVDGRAHTANGEPIANARIWIERADTDTRREAEQTARLMVATDIDGRFRFEGVAGGQHRIGGGGHASTASPLVVSVASGGTRTIDLLMVPSGIVRGRVVKNGVGVAGARIGVARGDADAARSQSDGTFILDRVPLGTISFVARPYRVRAPESLVVNAGENQVTIEVEQLGRVSGMVRWRGSAVPAARICAGRDRGPNVCTAADSTGRYVLDGLEPGSYGAFADDVVVGAAAHDVEFTITPGEPRELDIELRSGARVAGVVVDAKGTPVEAAHIELSSSKYANQSRCVSDANGRFECASMIDGTYEVAVFAGPGQSVPFEFSQPPPVLRLTDGNSRLENVRLVVNPERVEIRGTVVDASGVPVSDARLRAWGNDAYEPNWFDASPSTATDLDGRFRIAGLARGTYSLEARTGDGFRTIQQGVSAGAGNLRLVVDRALCRDPRLTSEGDSLRTAILASEPTSMRARSDRPLIWDQRVQLIGWDIPARVAFGTAFDMTLYYRVLAPIDQPWKVFVHFDGATRAGRADHEPTAGRCQMTTWRPGQYVADRFTARIEKTDYSPSGRYDVWTGFFTGFAPNWKNMPITDAPAAARDDVYQRVKIATVMIE